MLFVLFFVPLLLDGVFSFMDVITSVPVKEGDSVTLYADATEIQKADLILWTFGPDGTRIAQFNRMANKISLYEEILDGRFRDRLKLDSKTGSLTIRNTTVTDSGLYKLELIGGKEVPPKKFNIIVSAPLSIPAIIRDSSSSSSSVQYCSVVCSVVNVSAVSLSWYKGNSLLSSIGVSDLSISISLPLEVEYQDKNTYRCVINNTISNQTTHLDKNTLCQPFNGWSPNHIALVCVCVVAAVLCGFYFYHLHRMSKRGNKTSNKNRENGTVPLLLVEADGRCTSGQEEDVENSAFVKEDKITLMPVIEGETVTLQSNATEMREIDLILWSFAYFKGCSSANFATIATLNKINSNESIKQFKDSLKLDHTTGSLTITKMTAKHYGFYKLQIIRRGQMDIHTFSVFAHVPVKKERRLCSI
ncbi:uncharacterized protein LOC130216673 [Danio aesculapii]|uniref:uncharacterized protein LOC130216673 n=1 Tax=Danio aesculapii TaxID=1142201 RepID=UPI0024C02251|nr:uncharacterized protein LOC130216673 [Danio aesculapii]